MNELTSSDYNALLNSALAGRLGISIGIAAVISVMTLALLYSGLPFFGPVNDLTNALAGVLSALFAWQLYPILRADAPGGAGVFLLAAFLGALVIAGNSVMVAFGGLGWKVGGMYTAIGLALQGIWLLGMLTAAEQPFLTAGLVAFGKIAGAMMLAGFAAGPLMVYGERFYGNPLVWVIFISAATGWLLYPLWCWLAGRFLLS